MVTAFLKLVGLPASEIKLAFIPTAMNTEPGDKGWFVNELIRIRNLGVKQLDIVDISALPKEIWLPRLEEAHVIYVNGGNTTHLMKCFNDSGLTDEIPRLLETRVYAGASAGSYLATVDTRLNSDGVDEVLPGLKLVDYGIQAHLNSTKFPFARDEESVRERLMGCPYKVYAIDDESAIMVNGDKMEFVGRGHHITIEPSK